jgi:hypothetical protein
MWGRHLWRRADFRRLLLLGDTSRPEDRLPARVPAPHRMSPHPDGWGWKGLGRLDKAMSLVLMI